MTYEFLDQVGVDEFYDIETARIDEFIQEHIVDNLAPENINRNNMLSTQGFLDLLKQLLESIQRLSDTIEDLKTDVSDLYVLFDTLGLIQRIQIVTGSIDSIIDPDTHTLYAQHDHYNDKSWALYFYIDGNWYAVMNEEFMKELFVKYSEIEEYIEWLQSVLLKAIDDQTIVDIVEGMWEGVLLPESPLDLAMYRMEGSDLILTFAPQYAAPDLYINDDGDLIFNVDDERNYLEQQILQEELYLTDDEEYLMYRYDEEYNLVETIRKI